MKLIRKTIITREDKVPYLIRYSIFSCRWFAIKVHNLLISDDDCLHDHPWAFWSFIVKGGYWEHTFENAFDYVTKKKWYGPGNFLRRNSYWAHRLELPKDKTAWTIVITFEKKRSWGFFTRHG